MWKYAAAGIGILGAGCLIWSEYEKKNFRAEEYKISSSKIKGPDRRLVFLSDLHNNQFGNRNSRLIDAIDRFQPDLVLAGGDMMVCKGKINSSPDRQEGDFQIPLDLLKNLAKRYPVFCANGNHENRMDRERKIYGSQYDAYKKALLSGGIHLLADRSECFLEDLVITGVDLEEECYQKLYKGNLCPDFLEEHLGKAEDERFHILLAHSPLFFDRYAAWGADLTLAGHFHGGTIRLPFLGGIMTPQYHFFLPWCAGLFNKNQKYMIVSRGLGTHSINIRLNNRPELVAVTLTGLHS